MYHIIFNNKNSYKDLDLRIVKRPNIPAPVKNINVVEVMGRNGDLYEDLGGYKDLNIDVEFNFKDTVNIKRTWRKIKSWLFNIEDNKLIFSDDIEFYYKVKNIALSELTINKKILGKFTVTFTCEAYSYDVAGLEFIEVKNNSILYNYFDDSKPLLRIYSNTGGIGTITINNNSFQVAVNDCVHVDSNLELTYQDLVRPANLINGEYPTLKAGENKISFDSVISKIKIRPNWRTL